MVGPPFIIVTPVFEDSEAASRLFCEIASAFGAGARIIAVDDGSVGDPLCAEHLAASGLDGEIIQLNRNVGHQRAIAVGIDHVARQYPSSRVVVMDSDGEDLPGSIPALLAMLDDPDVDVVVAQRRSRLESLRFKLFYLLYKAIYWLLSGRRISFGNFMALKPTAVARLAAMGELGTHIAGTVLTSRLRWKECALDRGARYAGRSKMNFIGLVLHGLKGLMVFAEDVLVRVGTACMLVAAASLLGVLAAILLKSIGYASPGWFSVVMGVLLLMFVQTAAITLMTLLLTGIVRNETLLPMDYRRLIRRILPCWGGAHPEAEATESLWITN